jgi:REP-associated tyrosine transposase
MSEYVHKSHNVSVLMYHLVFPAKYRRTVLTGRVKKALKAVCLGIEKRYQIRFLKIGMEEDHVHFLVQSVPMYSPTKIVRTIKSITAKKIFLMCPEVKEALWGGEFWTKGYFVNTVSKHGNESVISEYVRSQGKGKYEELYKQQELFE